VLKFISKMHQTPNNILLKKTFLTNLSFKVTKTVHFLRKVVIRWAVLINQKTFLFLKRYSVLRFLHGSNSVKSNFNFRWLISQGKTSEAMKILKTTARINKVNLYNWSQKIYNKRSTSSENNSKTYKKFR